MLFGSPFWLHDTTDKLQDLIVEIVVARTNSEESLLWCRSEEGFYIIWKAVILSKKVISNLLEFTLGGVPAKVEGLVVSVDFIWRFG